MCPAAPVPYPLDQVRRQFPALERTHLARPVAYFDGPGGSQVVDGCIDFSQEAGLAR